MKKVKIAFCSLIIGLLLVSFISAGFWDFISGNSIDEEESYEKGESSCEGNICKVWELDSVFIDQMSIKIDIDPADDEDGLAALFIINDEEDYAIIKKVGESKELKNGYKIKLLALDQHYLTFELNCDGCGYGDKCYHFGDRKDGRYCSDTKQFLNQLEEDLDCENNFECSSNLCIDNSCISLGFLRKILSWFKNLFG